MKPELLSRDYVLTAGESDAEGVMPVPLLAERLIEIATEHANELGIGYATLIERNVGWVLSRLSIEMTRYPIINEHYSITTWIETYNRRFSERNFEIRDGEGRVAGYARSVWLPMDFASRTLADLAAFGVESFPEVDRPCPIAKAPRIAPLTADAESEDYTFRYCDLDFNRHVNTVRYIELILNHWPLSHYDKYAVGRIDVLFHHECRFGQSVDLRIEDDKKKSGKHSACEVVLPGNIRAVSALIDWAEL